MVLPLSFIAAELAFENTQEAHDFLEVHQAAVYQASSTNNSAGRQWDCKSVRDIMAAALMNYTKVDIKCALCISSLSRCRADHFGTHHL